jgi:two-component system sensor histidine kinase HydH
MTTTSHKLRHTAAIAGATVLIALVSAALPASWRLPLQHLLYLPIIYSGVRYGWVDGLGTALLAAACLVIAGLAHGHSPAQYWVVPILCAAGVLAGLLSERERKLRLTAESLVRSVSNVCDQLQQNFERMKRAERLSALGQLAAGLAHEIRNPLASIAGAAGILKRGQASAEKTAECVEIIHKESQRLSRLLTSFLDFARPRSPNYLTTCPESVVDSVLGLAEHAVSGTAISFRREVPPGLTFESDPEQLKQVLLNLVINAIQAMPEGGEVVIASHTQNGMMVIEVRDQGCGIGVEEMERIYDPFFTTKENGTGLGLPVAHQIVAHLGGVLSARRNPDRGMTFSVELPLRQGIAP